MPIVMPLCSCVNKYLGAYLHNRPDIEVLCPRCGCVMGPWDRYFRRACPRGICIRVPVYRWRCPGCHKTCGVLPDFLSPYLPHITQVREACVRLYSKGQTVEEVAEDAGVEPRTVSRWVNRVARALEGAIPLISQMVARLPVMIHWPRAQVRSRKGRIGLLFHLGDILRRFKKAPGSAGVFPRVNLVNLHYL